MTIGPITIDRSGGDLSWLGSRHGVSNAHPGTLAATKFKSADGVVDGVVPAGYPLSKGTSGTYEPYTDVAGLAGFTLDDRDISRGDALVPVLWHGRIKVGNLPIDFTAPADGGAFTFEEA